MVDIQKLLYMGSVTIFMNKDGKLIGNALIQLEDGYVPIKISENDLSFIYSQVHVMNKLKDGYVLYMVGGAIYLGLPKKVNAYGEDEIFLSSFDSQCIYFCGLVENLEYKTKNDDKNEKMLVKIGEFYKPLN